MSFSLNEQSIVNLLTLRYNPLQKPLISKITADDLNSIMDVDKNILKELLIYVINREIKGKKRVALTLSSGVDSTLLLSLIRDTNPSIKIDCICAIFDENHECKCATELASRFNAEIHIIDFRDINILDDMPLHLSIVKEPRWNLYFYYIVKEASKYSDMLITGDGGDELFGGYTFRYSKFLKYNATSWRDKALAYLSCHERDHVPDQHKLFGDRIRFNWDNILALFKPYFDNNLESLQQVFLADFNGKLLFDWIPTNTKLFQHFSLHGVTPFLDRDVIRMAMSIDPRLKFDQRSGIGKIILREILSEYNIHLNNSKIGFTLDTRTICKNHKETLFYYLDDARIVKDGWINKEWLDKALKMLETEDIDVRYVNKILALLAFEIWYRLFITKEIKY
ncbi:MAG: asparagine synthase C-terminal domain-containing protein [Candidatus Nitrosocaldaceae archaeon]